MLPNVYVSETYFDCFDEEWENNRQINIFSTHFENEEKSNSLFRIRDLLLASNIYSDISDKKLIKYFTKEFGTYTTIKDFIFHTKIKDASTATKGTIKTKTSIDNCKKSGTCFFIDQDFKYCTHESNKTGKIILGKEFLTDPFYLNHTFASIDTDESISNLDIFKHPCSGIIIVDRYIFDDTTNRASKITSLIKFLKHLINSNFENKFQVDIITQSRNNNSSYEKKINQILEAFSGNISLHVYAPTSLKENYDRYLITNYAVLTVGHPFDRPTYISSNFFPSNGNSELIKNSFNYLREKIHSILEVINTTPKMIGLVQLVWKSDNENHSIYNI
jgi:hypothetical protein